MNPEPIHDGDLRTAFTLLVKGFERLEDKVDQTIAGLGELKEEQVAQGLIGQRTFEEARKTNGRVNDLEKWQDGHDRGHMEEDKLEAGALGYEAGRQSVRAADRALLRRTWARIEKPVAYAVLAVLIGVGAKFGDWLLEGGWPW